MTYLYNEPFERGQSPGFFQLLFILWHEEGQHHYYQVSCCMTKQQMGLFVIAFHTDSSISYFLKSTLIHKNVGSKIYHHFIQKI